MTINLNRPTEPISQWFSCIKDNQLSLEMIIGKIPLEKKTWISYIQENFQETSCLFLTYPLSVKKNLSIDHILSENIYGKSGKTINMVSFTMNACDFFNISSEHLHKLQNFFEWMEKKQKMYTSLGYESPFLKWEFENEKIKLRWKNLHSEDEKAWKLELKEWLRKDWFEHWVKNQKTLLANTSIIKKNKQIVDSSESTCLKLKLK